MITEPIDAYRLGEDARATAPAEVSIAAVIEEAMALWGEVVGRRQDAGSVDGEVRMKRAARLLRAAEASYLALGGSSGRAVGRRREAPARSAAPSQTVQAPFTKPSGPLSAREVEVLRLVAAGQTDRQIAQALFISRRTATTHVCGILNKLAVDNRTAAAAAAVRSGLV
jgi:DNA-binding NarL/FixJ family response regulator